MHILQEKKKCERDLDLFIMTNFEYFKLEGSYLKNIKSLIKITRNFETLGIETALFIYFSILVFNLFYVYFILDFIY